jgi:hypothetical protein
MLLPELLIRQATLAKWTKYLKGSAIATTENSIKTIEDFWVRIPQDRLQAIREAFDGNPTLKFATEDRIFYRRWGGYAEEFSNWLSPTNYTKPGNAKRYLALPNNNSAENITVFKIRKGTPYLQGKVASQVNDMEKFGGYAVGGGDQIYLLFEDITSLIKIK